jgi:hypothetical protein
MHLWQAEGALKEYATAILEFERGVGGQQPTTPTGESNPLWHKIAPKPQTSAADPLSTSSSRA